MKSVKAQTTKNVKNGMCVAIGFGVLFFTSTGSAQAPAAGQKISLAQGLQRAYAGIKTNLNEAATKMPDADYSYRPSPEIRTYAGQLAHVAFWNYVFCSAAKGETNPNTEELEKTKTTKADVMKVLADSFTYCDAAFASLTDENALQPVKLFQNETARGSVLANTIAHDNEEYGIVTVYLRTRNMVPPSTERQMRGRGGR
jgi:uncharacterized damage-inducible protein DinB